MWLAHVMAITMIAIVTAAGAGADRWNLRLLLITGALAVISDLMYVESGSARLKVSGCHLAIMLTVVLMGGGPGAAVGVLTIAVGWLRSREPAHYLRNNLVVFAAFPLLAGRFFHALVSTAHAGPHSAAFYLFVFVSFIVSLALNWLGIVGYQCYLDGGSLAQKARESLLPLLAADLFSALLTMGTVYVTVVLGTVGLLLNGLVLLVFQYLIGELLKSKQRSRDLHRLATTDELTGLANRESFRERLEARTGASDRAQTCFAVMLMDLDHFKEVNDTLGHHYGDMLLRDLGRRLAERLGPSGLVARLGGDEFALLPPQHTDDPEVLEAVARDLLECVQEPVFVDEVSLQIGGSIGIARYPRDGRDAATLLRRADSAMYAAKEKQTGCGLHSEAQEQHSARRLTVMSDFRRALANDQLVVHYQPIVDLATHEVLGAEGLVRWAHPELGVLPPGAFVQEVEQTGLIGPMTRYVLERAVAQCAEWHAQGLDLAVAVNLSARNLLDRHLLRDIERLLSAYHVSPSALKLEITESMLMSDPERARATVNALSELGVRISVDDFGTGYSSLAKLRSLPIDELKIDRGFVTPMLRDESDLIIVRSTINLAHDLGLAIIAEGVEDEPTLDRLALLGCDQAQGYHLSRPLPAEDLTGWLARQNGFRAAA